MPRAEKVAAGKAPMARTRFLKVTGAERELNQKTIDRARRYAYHFFFRRMIPLESIAPASGVIARQVKYRVGVETIDELKPGRDLGLDVICEGILTGKPFTFPAEAHL